MNAALTSSRSAPGATLAGSARHAGAIGAALDDARERGPLRQIVIPPCPQLLLRLQQAIRQPEPDLNAVAQIASSDVAMAAALMKYANSAIVGSLPPVNTVGQAMYRLGLDETAAVLTGFLARRAIRVDHPQLRNFWCRASRRSIAMTCIARSLPGQAVDVAHTFGLFLDVGTPVLLQSVKGYGSTMVEAEARRDRPYVATENANHRTDHAVVGALVARLWRLAPQVMAAVRLHHELEALGSPGIEPEVNTLLAAGLVATHLVRRHEGLDPERAWLEHADAALAWLEVGPAELEDWEHAAFAAMDAS